MTVTFESATADAPRGNGTYEVDLIREYAVGGTKPNGGYLLACLGRAALGAPQEAGSPHAHVVAAAAQYFASPDLGPARIAMWPDLPTDTGRRRRSGARRPRSTTG